VTLGEFPRPDRAASPASAAPAEAPEQVLGFTVMELTPQLAQQVGYRGEGGVIVADATQGSGASRAGLRRGSVVLAVNGRRVRSPQEVRDIARGVTPGSAVSVTVFDLTLGEVLRTYRTRQ
jgi:serine protease Do